MVKVSTLVRTAICALALVGASAFAQTGPKDALKALQDYRTQLINDARQSGKPLNAVTYNESVKAKALELIKDVDPAKVEDKDAYDWAQLFQSAGKNKEVCDLCHKFLMTNPAPDVKFRVQMLMMNSCNALGEADMLVMTLKDIKPVDAMMGRSLMSIAANSYVDTIVKSKGVNEGLKVLDELVAKQPAEDHKANAQALLDAAKKREAANPPATAPKSDAERLVDFEKQSVNTSNTYLAAVINKKAELLTEAGRKPEAVKEMKAFIAKVGADSPAARSMSATLKREEMVGAPAVALNAERSHGEFKGLDSLKGKVVIIDFFAHWCPPCKASYPDMRKLYDDLHGKGLEMVGVTTYYGYYNQEKNLSKDDEFARMADFIKEFNIAWPVVYGDRTNFEAYGVTGIPQVTVIDRKGNVHSFDIGYSPEIFKKFRAEIEKLVNEK